MKNTFNKIAYSVGKKSPEILMGISIVGVISTTVMAVRTTPKAVRLLDERKMSEAKELSDDWEDIKIEPLEVVQLTWKLYIPVVIMGSVTVACIIGNSRVHTKRNAALAGLYTLTERTLSEYQNKVIETIGEKKEKEVRASVAQDRVTAEYAPSNVITTGVGDVLFYDLLSGRFFRSTVEKVRKAENDFNQDLFNDYYGTLNEFYGLLNLKPIILGEDLGWNANSMLKLYLGSATVTDQGEPCIVVEFENLPDSQFR